MSSSDIGMCNPVISVHYPGVVRDVTKMLETLGGIRMISAACAEKSRRLGLRFRPDDSFCKPAFATRKPVVGLVLKVKFKKKKIDRSETVVSYQVIGSVTEEYRFNNLCDFQFLPTSKDECLYDTIIPHGLDPEWLNVECSNFLPPAAFSRVDTVQNFNFSKIPVEDDKLNVIGRLKRKRYGCTKCVTFDTAEVPTLAKEIPFGATSSAKIVTSETLEELKALFQKRPIYSKTAIRCISQLPLIQLKCLLPCVAYYFINGPWRSLWVRFGYDPRKDPNARVYQTLDYRVRNHLTKNEVKIKRPSGSSSLSYRQGQTGKNISVITRNPTEEAKEKEDKSEPDEHIFRPDMIPPSRQCYYQYCDVHVPEVKALLENLEDIDENAICHEIDGWMPSTMADKCRNIMNKYVSEEVKRRSKLSINAPNSLIVEVPNAISSASDSNSTDSEQE